MEILLKGLGRMKTFFRAHVDAWVTEYYQQTFSQVQFLTDVY